MNIRLILLSAILSLICNVSNAQIEGDNLFAEDQIVNIELDFSQVGFWDSLTLNYETETYMKAELTITDKTGTYSFADVGIRLKGNSSYGHPGVKKSFKIDFNKYVTGQNYDGLKKLNLSNGFKDPTMIREKLFFDVCRAADVAAPRANFANVFFNGTLWGFYTLVEQIDDQFLDWKILDDDGNLFKAAANFGGGGGPGGGGGGNEADLKYYGEDQADYEESYELKSNEDENDWSDLIALTKFIDTSTPTEFEEGLGERMELSEYLRSAALDNLFGNLDSYTGSARNFYIYHNLTTDKWEWIKWDGNEAFGTYAAGVGNVTGLALDYHDNNRPLLENIFASPVLFAQYQKEICNLVENYFNPVYMNERINAMRDLVKVSVYADDNKMYSDANFDTNIESNLSGGGGGPGGGGGSVLGLKSFVQERNAFVTNELDCSLISSVSQNEFTNVKLYPNPTSGIISLEGDFSLFDGLAVYNVIGQQVYKVTIENTDKVALDLTFLQKGTYFAKFKSKNAEAKIGPSIKLIKL